MSIPNYKVIDKQTTTEQLKLTVEISFAKDSVYFDGHFDEIAILPAVAQLFVAQNIAAIEFGELGRFNGLSQVKFKALIQPNHLLKLNLDYNKNTATLSFSYSYNDAVASSGKLKY